MAETYVSRPHFEELTQVSEKVHATVGIFSTKVLLSQTNRDTPESAARLFGLPLMNRILG